MTGRRIVLGLMIVGLLLPLAGGPGLAQGPEDGVQRTGAVSIEAVVSSKFSYQGLLTEGGLPVTGERDMTFRLHSDAGCTAQVGDDMALPGVQVSDGFFSVELAVQQSHFDGQGLWLEVVVGSTAIACQEILPVPYALGLRPGATISGPAAESVLAVENTGAAGGNGGYFTGFTGIRGEGTGASGYGGYFASANNDGVGVWSAGDDGVYVKSADDDGVQVSAGDDGFHVQSAGDDGIYVESTGDNGIYIESAGDDGIHVESATDDGIWVGAVGDDGVWVDGASDRGVYANTTRTNHEWGFHTPDKLYIGSTLVSAGSWMLVAQNGDDGELELGDVVVAAGLGAPFADSLSPIPLVRRADAASSQAIAGVVYGRFVAEEGVKEDAPEGGVERYTHFDTHTTEGATAPGEYLLIVVLGPCQVKADATDGPIQPGDLLVISDRQGRAVRTRPLTAEGASSCPLGATLGTALEPLAEDAGLIHVLVTPR